jgi:decaprenyl-phosphate phosphoribosyltransferase
MSVVVQESVRSEEPGTPRRRGLLRGLVREARPKQWVKNVLVVAAPAAGAKLFHPTTATQTAIMFVLFCMAASGVYYINDALDVDNDRAHPAKRNRPIAAGIVPLPLAYAIGGGLLAAAVAGAGLLLNRDSLLLMLAYGTIQIAYCLYLKHMAVVDIVVVASGFLMRATAGGLATGVSPSKWFLITTGFGSLFVVAAKRAGELEKLGEQSEKTRKLLSEYSPSFLRFVWQGAAVAMILSYCLWALDRSSPGVSGLRMVSIVPIVLAVLRYALIVDRGEGGAPEDVLLGDRAIVAFAALWLLSYGAALF